MKNELMDKIIEKIAQAESILIAIAKNPTVDELATAIGLQMFFDKIGKRATAIYSGATPNALEFLRPEEKFDADTNGLQDFIIAINKDKADHLRYKLDGDFVKVFITPYKSRINQEDLVFSYGEFNVDLVVALNVKNVDDLDAALSEYGRILHDASVVNITTDAQGKFGEVVWSEAMASSVGEMVSKMVLTMKEKGEVDKDVATALLTGIVAATERFSNEKTRPETMAVAAKLMAAGADQQLVSSNMEKEGNAAVALDNNVGVPGVALDNGAGGSQVVVNAVNAQNVSAAEIAMNQRGENGLSETKLPTVQAPITYGDMQVPNGSEMPNVQMPKQAIAEPELKMATMGGNQVAEIVQGTRESQVAEDTQEVQGEEEIPEEEKGPGIGEVNYRGVIDQALGNTPRNDFNRPVSMSDKPEIPENNSYISGSQMKVIQPISTGGTDNNVVIQPIPVEEGNNIEIDNSVTGSALPMPGDEILPPPPTPPVQF